MLPVVWPGAGTKRKVASRSSNTQMIGLDELGLAARDDRQHGILE